MSALAQPESKFLTVNDLRLHYLDWGNPGAPPLVYVHGLRETASAFNAPARRLRDRYHIVAVDMRGHGDSDWAVDGAYQFRDQASDLAGFVDQLGFAQFRLVGTSMGGRIALTYAGSQPQRLQRLVINDIGPELEGAARITQVVASGPTDFASLDEGIDYGIQTRSSLAILSREEKEEWLAAMLRQLPNGRWGYKQDPEYVRQRVANGPPVPPEWSVLQRITCPTLVVWAMDSESLSGQQAQRMIGVLQRGELVAVPGIGHAPTLMEPVALSALERFLGGPE